MPTRYCKWETVSGDSGGRSNAYLEAMRRRHVEATMAHMAENVVLRSPIAPTPFEGKERVADVLAKLLSTVDAFEPKLLLRDNADFVAVFTIRFSDEGIDGMDPCI
ncbi:nuclear transport factor 2 family protein [Paraburkholderia sp. BR13444]|uniref:nuclear transport factor 2 family protein n=1 Tax=Paraburkholderia TaxID=1822464 RepID=UPI0034CE1D93